MKKGTERLTKTTSVIAELGVDFQESDLESNGMGGKCVKKAVLRTLVQQNFKSIACPTIDWYGWYDEETKTYRFSVAEDLFI
ncbi:MAG: hypothetical protein IKT93_00215 [Clostridia bacterium]|nr:hypothetical protein [Clostridia bacterium]